MWVLFSPVVRCSQTPVFATNKINIISIIMIILFVLNIIIFFYFLVLNNQSTNDVMYSPVNVLNALRYRRWVISHDEQVNISYLPGLNFR